MATAAEGRLVEGSSNDFQSLEEKIYRAIEMLKEARAQKASAEAEVASIRETLEAQAAEADALRQQLHAMQQERAELRGRVEKLLGEVDAILDE